ncbi:unnamed protein product [Paramecium primaurelia]|uniref:Uncharacterized protein n=1 Tax=Paramecium primaurelia TaxID=5886 RepID=A0A8S1JY47_PARPR|nr:unnamed protein product [Paramecium primaurelia]
MSIKQKLYQTWHRFLQTNFNSYLRSAPTPGKQRLYKHVDIQNEFDKFEKERRKQRLQLIEYKNKLKKRVLEKEIALIKQFESSQIDYVSTNASLENNNINKDVTMDEQRRQSLIKELEIINNQLTQIDKEKEELKILENDIAELEPNMVILRGIQKKTVLTMINYIEFQHRHVSGLVLNPETMKNIETVHYHVMNNLPIQREKLYEVVPELFQEEIGELDEYKQKLIQEIRPTLDVQETSVIQIIEKSRIPESNDPIVTLLNEQREMMMFVYNKCTHFCNKYDDWIEMKLKQGFPDIDAIIENLLLRKDLSGIDLEVYEGYKELEKINDDYHDLLELNKIKIRKEQNKLEMPPFVESHELLRKVWTEKWEAHVKNSLDFSQSILIPHNTYESKLDQVLADYKKHDIQDLIEQSNQALKEKLGGDQPVQYYDRKDKDINLVKQIQILGDIMHQIPTHEEELKELQKKAEQFDKLQIDDKTQIYKSEEGRILLTELPKVLHLNNKDPKQYNLLFWAEHFNIEPQKLRNIFNFIHYPILDQQNKEEKQKILKFIYQ